MSVYISGLLLTEILIIVAQLYIRHKKYVFVGQKVRFEMVKLINIIPMIPLIVIAGIRYNVGYDYKQTYVYIFNKVLGGYSNDVWGDFGYTLLNKFVILFTDDYVGIFIVTAIIFVTCCFTSIYKESQNVPMSVFLLVCAGFYFNFLNGMRQMLAVAILMLSFEYIRQRNIWKFLAVVIVACLFHSSALIFIPVYYLYNIKWDNYKRFIFVLSVFAGSKIIAIIIRRLIMYTKYSWYFTSNYVSEREGYIATIISISIFIFACLFSKNKEDNLFINMQMVEVCVQAFIGLIPQINRIGWYYGFAIVFLIPNVIQGMGKKRNASIIKTAIYVLYFIYFVYTVGIKNSNAVLPYQTIFDRW